MEQIVSAVANSSKLSDRDKQELQQFLGNETQKANIQAAIHSLTNTCFQKCIPAGPIKKGALDKYEEPCVRQCVDRFFDATSIIIEELNKLQR